jgi:metal-sulfur cluster biosynthetic enzyme
MTSEQIEGPSTPTRATVMEALKSVIDPELCLNVVELGMIGEINIDGGKTSVTMRLTSMSCPFWALFVDQVENAVRTVDGVEEVSVSFDRSQAWAPDLMSDAARTELETIGLMPRRARKLGADPRA